MAAADALTEQHRQAQTQLRTQALRDFLTLWPLWKGDAASFAALVSATQPLVSTYRNLSATIAAAYYQSFRAAETVPGTFTPILAAAADPKILTASMYVTGKVMTRDALTAGQSPEQARQTALTRVSGAVTRHVLDGARDTILGSVDKDDRATGWARVTDGNPCAFCLVLASRGAVYKSEGSADFQAHDHDACVAAPVWDGTPEPANTQRFKDIYNAAQRQGLESGSLQHGENTPQARINAVRQYLTAQNATE